MLYLRIASLAAASVALVAIPTIHAEQGRRIIRLPIVLAQMLPDAGSSSSGTADALRPVEKSFVVQGLENSRSQAELSRLAVSQASSSALREFAQQLVGDYREINITLENIARRKTVAVPIQPTSYSSDYRELAGHSGTAFDRAFVRELASANDRILRLCEAALANGKDADIRDVAGSLLPVVRDHINKTTMFLKAM